MTAWPDDRELPCCRRCEDRGWLPDDTPCPCGAGEQLVAQADFESHLRALDDGTVL